MPSKRAGQTSSRKSTIDLTGLPDMPDVDALVDEGAEFDARTAGEVTGRKSFALSYRETARKTSEFDLRKTKKASECIHRLPVSGEYIHIVVGQEFAGFDLLPVMLDLAGANRFDELTLTTLGFNRDNLEQLRGMFAQGKLTDLRVLCGDFFRRADSDLWDMGKLIAGELNFGWRSYRNHTKLILAKIGKRHLVVESSANLRSCQNIEQFTMTDSKGLYHFHRGWIDEIWPHSKE